RPPPSTLFPYTTLFRSLSLPPQEIGGPPPLGRVPAGEDHAQPRAGKLAARLEPDAAVGPGHERDPLRPPAGHGRPEFTVRCGSRYPAPAAQGRSAGARSPWSAAPSPIPSRRLT